MSTIKLCHFKKISIFIIVITILLTTTSFESYAASSSQIALKAKSNGKYVCADPKRQKLYANKSLVKTWETFTLVDLGNNQVALKAKSNGKYVCANPNGSPLVANKSWVRSWETFTLVNLGNNQVALKAKSNGKYVCADPKGRPLAANKSWARTWETFTIEYLNTLPNNFSLNPSYTNINILEVAYEIATPTQTNDQLVSTVKDRLCTYSFTTENNIIYVTDRFNRKTACTFVNGKLMFQFSYYYYIPSTGGNMTIISKFKGELGTNGTIKGDYIYGYSVPAINNGLGGRMGLTTHSEFSSKIQ